MFFTFTGVFFAILGELLARFGPKSVVVALLVGIVCWLSGGNPIFATAFSAVILLGTGILLAGLAAWDRRHI